MTCICIGTNNLSSFLFTFSLGAGDGNGGSLCPSRDLGRAGVRQTQQDDELNVSR